jgi:hypothetical protein
MGGAPAPSDATLCSSKQGERDGEMGFSFNWRLWQPIPGVLYKSFWEEASRAGNIFVLACHGGRLFQEGILEGWKRRRVKIVT